MRYSRKQIEEIKQNIPQQAYTLFSNRGIEEVTMQNIADACGIGVATLYRYYGTKIQLVGDVYKLKWQEISQDVREQYFQIQKSTTAYEDFEFCLNSVLYVYKNYPEFLCFFRNFSVYIQNIDLPDNLNHQMVNMSNQAIESFEVHCFSKASKDHTVRQDIPVKDLYVATILSLYYTAAKYAKGILIPFDGTSSPYELLNLQKEMHLHFVQGERYESKD